ncbi:MAG TPA: COX15/CtaA family protein [Pyrinomonadaceae bacterium]|nr:COX15/CtaA family protein [Pyrinomonadaceae bacterium]
MKLNRFAAYAWGVAAYILAVIAWGAYVRASGSGAGCGAHWPLCNGEVIPRAPQIETLVELTHRVTSGLAGLLVLALLVWAIARYRRRADERAGAVLWASVASSFFIITEALIGAGLVLFEYVADNASTARAVWMAVHLVNTFLLMASLALAAWWASGGAPLRLRGQGRTGLLFASAVAGALLLAVSGAVAALGDTLNPAASLAEGLRQDFSPTASALVRLRLLHPTLAAAVGILLLFTASHASAARPGAWVKRLSLALAALVVAQVAVGLANVALLAPIWLQLVHLLLADLMWLSLVLLAASALSVRAESEQRSAAPVELPSAVEL